MVQLFMPDSNCKKILLPGTMPGKDSEQFMMPGGDGADFAGRLAFLQGGDGVRAEADGGRTVLMLTQTVVHVERLHAS